MGFDIFWYNLDLDIHTCECHGPSLDLVMTFAIQSQVICGLSSWTRLVTVAQNNSGTVRTCVETWTFFICRAVSWLELVVVSHDHNFVHICVCAHLWYNLDRDIHKYFFKVTFCNISTWHFHEYSGLFFTKFRLLSSASFFAGRHDLVTDAYRRFVESRLEMYPF